MLKTLNIIGCGHLGKALGRLWQMSGTFAVQDVVNRSIASADDAVRFIGGGRALEHCKLMRAADLYMIGTPESAISSACEALGNTELLQPGQVVFHCSGALPASIMQAAAEQGAAIASLHPIKSFADPWHAVEHFAGTWCGIEGDAPAVELLGAASTAIGAQWVAINPEFKGIYHAAAVFSSNYLVTLLDVALQAYEKAGIPQATALKLIEPLVRGTVDNIFSIGTTQALSGPIARGDTATVVRQYRALNGWNRRHGHLYRELGKATTRIARRRKKDKPSACG